MKAAIVVPNFNGMQTVSRCIRTLLLQEAPPHWALEVILVDDGSEDGSADAVAVEFADRVKLVRLPRNLGRCTARNTGAWSTDADVLIFVDSDCIACGRDFLASHLAAVESGADLVFGGLIATADGFWSELQNDAARRRAGEFERGNHWIFTTANVAVRRDAFDAVNGFDAAFDRHGLEDRDFFIRLIEFGVRPAYAPGATVAHDGEVNLESVSRKLFGTGRFASELFARKHPREYRRLVYSRLDCRLNPGLGWVDAITWPLTSRLIQHGAAWTKWRHVPFGAKALLARAIYGLSFMHGTAEAIRENRRAGSVPAD